MKDKLLMALGILRALVSKDYVGQGLRQKFRRLGRNTLNRLSN